MKRGHSSIQGSFTAQKKNRFLQLVLLALSIVIAVLAILYGSLLASRSSYSMQINQEIRAQVDLALGQLNTLSRTGGSSTDSVLAKARQHVYAARTLSEQGHVFTGQHPLDPSLFDALLTMLDEFERRKQTGQPTMETQTALIASLSTLRERANDLLLN